MEAEHSFHGLEVWIGEDFEELGWSSGYLGHKVEKRTKQRTSTSRGVDSDLEGVSSNQLEPAQTPERAGSNFK